MKPTPQNNLSIISDKILDEAGLAEKVRIWKFFGKKIVFTNGVFDILHKGHIHYLSQAKDLGDVLVIGLNSDASVKRLGKGSSRPLQDEGSRATVLAALRFVNAVTLFTEDTPEQLIEKICPDVLVKGGDYADLTKIAGYKTVHESGGLVTTIPFLEGYSTTAIEEKIRNQK